MSARLTDERLRYLAVQKVVPDFASAVQEVIELRAKVAELDSGFEKWRRFSLGWNYATRWNASRNWRKHCER